MLFSVASHAFLIQVELDSQWKIVDHAILRQGYHYGTALIGNGAATPPSDGIVVFCGGSSFTTLDDMRFIGYPSIPPVEESYSRPVAQGLSDVHQIAYANGGLYIANTRRNSIVFQDLDGSIVHDFHIGGLYEDKNHINSVYPCGEQVFALLHNRGQRESQVLVFRHDATTGFRVEAELSLWHGMAHNLFVDDERLYYNASAAKSFVAVDLTTQQVIKEIPFPGRHTKGMSVMDDYVVVGLSDHTLNHLRRSRTAGRLAIIDRRSLELASIVELDFPDLPHPIGNVNEVRCLSGEELGHTRAEAIPLDFSAIKLAQKNAVGYALNRGKFKAAIPVRKVKRYWEKWSVEREQRNSESPQTV